VPLIKNGTKEDAGSGIWGLLNKDIQLGMDKFPEPKNKVAPTGYRSINVSHGRINGGVFCIGIFTHLCCAYGFCEVEYQASTLNKLLEPLIIVILGLIVGVVLIAMYLPLFKLGYGF
jgi:hypothetical protein